MRSPPPSSACSIAVRVDDCQVAMRAADVDEGLRWRLSSGAAAIGAVKIDEPAALQIDSIHVRQWANRTIFYLPIVGVLRVQINAVVAISDGGVMHADVFKLPFSARAVPFDADPTVESGDGKIAEFYRKLLLGYSPAASMAFVPFVVVALTPGRGS